MRLTLLFFVVAFEIVQGQVNSKYDEQNPVLSPDGKELFFTIARHPSNVRGLRDLGDVWVSKEIDGQWQAPQPVKGQINNGGYNTVLGFSNDGTLMYLYGHYNSSGDESGSQGISVSKRVGESWSLPRNEIIPSFKNNGQYSGGYITPDKSIFVYSAEGVYDSFGNEDIYVCFNRDGVWTEPLNVGSQINSTLQEQSPFIIDKSLYFASNKPDAEGSFDIYVSERQDDSWANWSSPKRLGSNVNTSGRELYYREDSFISKAYYTSTTNSDGYADIKWVDLNKGKPEPKITIAQLKKDSSIFFHGTISDKSNGKGIAALLSIALNENRMLYHSDGAGTYGLKVKSKGLYNVSIEAPGYMTLEQEADLTNPTDAEIIIDYKLEPIAVGVTVKLKHVLFRQSTSELLNDSYDELDQVVEFLKTNPTVQIELAGHTDNGGNASLNLKLSRERVARVKNYLVSKGIEANRVKSVGYGEAKPIAPNDTEESRKLNRRVEFKIIKK